MTDIDISRERLADLESNLEKSYRIGTDENETELYDIDGLEDCAWEVFAYAGALRDALDAAKAGQAEAVKAWAEAEQRADSLSRTLSKAVFPEDDTDAQIAEAAAAQRERDAQIATNIMSDNLEDTNYAYDQGWVRACQRIAAAIRAQEDKSDD